MTIRKMDPTDLDAVARVHAEAFPGFFLTRMGSRFVRFYYACCLEYEQGICRVHVDEEGEVNGFVAGFVDPAFFYTSFAKRKIEMIGPILHGFLRDPSVLWRLLYNVKRVGAASYEYGDVELSSIGVGGQGRGVGSALLKAFLEDVADLGLGSVTLTTDAEGNENVNRFYERSGFTREGTFDSGGRAMNVYRMELD